MPTKVSMSSIIRAKSGCSIRIVRVSVSHTTVISGIIYLTPAAKLALQSRLPHAIETSANSSRSTTRNGLRPAAIITNPSGSATSVHALGSDCMTPSSLKKNTRS